MHVYSYLYYVYEQMRRDIVLGNESALGAWGWSRRVALAKSLIYARKKRRLWARVAKFS